MTLTIAIEGKGVLTDAETTTNWFEQGTTLGVVQDDNIFLQGSFAVSTKASAKAGWLGYDVGVGNELDFDVAGTEENQHIYIWVNVTTLGALDTKATGALAIRLGSGADKTSNTSDWVIGGSDDTNGYTGGWKCYVLDPTTTPTSAVGTLDLAAIRYFGIYIDTSGSSRAENLIIDTIAVGSGLRITGTDVTGWQEVMDYCTAYATRAWGMMQEREGLYYVYGKLYVGDSAQAAITSLTDTGRIFKFGDSEYWTGSAWVSMIADDFGGVVVEDAASYTTTLEDGVIVGTDNGRSGSTFIGSPLYSCSVDLYGGSNAASITKLYNTTFRLMSGGIVWGDDVDHLFYGGIVDQCGQFDPVGAVKIRNCTFSGYSLDADGGLLWNSNIDIELCKFIANTDVTNDPHAIEHPAAGTFGYIDLLFSGNDYDINNNALAILMDSYQPTEDGDVDVYAGSIIRVSQQFTATVGDLSRATWSIRKQGSPTGNVYARAYANSGGVPTGVLLAESNPIDITTLTTAFADVEFEFEDEYTLSGIDYHVSVEYNGGDAANRLEVEYLAAGDAGETCNTYVSSWSGQTYDCRFAVNRDGIVKINATDSDPGLVEETATVRGATIIVNTVTLTITCKNASGLAIEGIKVRIETDPGGVLISEGTTNASGVYSDSSYNYEGAQAVKVVARLKGYRNNAASDSIGATGLSIPFTMIRDEAVNLP